MRKAGPARKSGLLAIAGVRVSFETESVRALPAVFRPFLRRAPNRNAALKMRPLRCENPYDFENALRATVAARLAAEGGLLLHASGVAPRLKSGRRAAATVFCGKSGAGKSTIAAAFPARDVLSDEIVAVARRAGKWRAAATPFRGTLSRPGPDFSAPVGRIFFARHAARLAAAPLSVAETYRRIMRCAILPRAADTPKAAAALAAAAATLAEDVRGEILDFSLKDTGKIKKTARLSRPRGSRKQEWA